MTKLLMATVAVAMVTLIVPALAVKPAQKTYCLINGDGLNIRETPDLDGTLVAALVALNQLRCGVDPLELDASGSCCKAPIRLCMTAIASAQPSLSPSRVWRFSMRLLRH